MMTQSGPHGAPTIRLLFLKLTQHLFWATEGRYHFTSWGTLLDKGETTSTQHEQCSVNNIYTGGGGGGGSVLSVSIAMIDRFPLAIGSSGCSVHVALAGYRIQDTANEPLPATPPSPASCNVLLFEVHSLFFSTQGDMLLIPALN